MADRSARAVGDLAFGTPIDLDNCAREPIHIPGQIQAHGVLLALEASSLVVQQASDNTDAYLGRQVAQLLGLPAAALFPEERAADLARIVGSEPIEDNPLFLFTSTVCGAGPFHVIGHLHDGVLLLELEVPQPAAAPRPDFYELLKRGLARFQSARGVRELGQLVVEEVRRVSGYDRVMVYQFGEDWSGHIVAESMDPGKGLESYLGLHYPASDIPAQARALFLLNTVRMLPDARYRASRIVPELCPRTGRPLDLSHTFLRGASQMYTEYLTNMGVRATLTMAIAKADRMWGMLVCHHYAPRQIPYDVRAACELLARVVSVQMVDKQAQEEEAYRRRIAATHDAIVKRLAQHAEVDRGLWEGTPSVADLVERAGVALCGVDRCRRSGEAPEEAELAALCRWLDGHQTEDVFATDALPALYPRAVRFQDSACGLLSLRVSRATSEYVLWMRPELIRTEHWAGDPSKPVETGPFGDRLTPRKSFALWQETVRGRSAAFTPVEIEAATRLRAALADALLLRGEKLARAAHNSRSLLEVADALSAAQTEQEVVAVILDRGLSTTGAQAVFLDRPAGAAGPPSALPDGLVEGPAGAPPGAGAEVADPAAAVSHDRLVVFSSDGARRPEPDAAALARGGAGPSPPGMSFAFPAQRTFSAEDEEFLRTLARLCGQALLRARLADQALRASEAYRGSLVDSLEDHVVVLDPQGRIVDANEAWRRFALDNGGQAAATGVGANYLDHCQRVAPGSDDGSAAAALQGIRDVIAGRVEKFGLEYPCHSPTRRRWFALRVSRAAGREPGSVVVSHSDVTTLKQAEERLRQTLAERENLVHEVHEQNRRVEEASRLKSEFLANMSHELRTPLNGIIGFSELLTDGKAGPISEVQRDYLGDVLSSARHLHELINDVLDLSKVESGKLEFHPEPVDVGRVLRDVRDILRTVAEGKRIRVETTVDRALDEVVIDASRFRQVLFNYLSNALKFTPEGGRVRLSLTAEDEDRFRLEVTDTGIGIRADDMSALFVEFRQLDASSAKKYPGTGLGLALTRRIVEAQGGHVGARSEPGKGSVFIAVLPRHPLPAADEDRPSAEGGGPTNREAAPWPPRTS